jgi:hypothetical protein
VGERSVARGTDRAAEARAARRDEIERPREGDGETPRRVPRPSPARRSIARRRATRDARVPATARGGRTDNRARSREGGKTSSSPRAPEIARATHRLVERTAARLFATAERDMEAEMAAILDTVVVW